MDSARRGLALNLSDILVLAGFAFSQPLLDVLSRSPELFVVHRSKPADILLLVFCAYAVPWGIFILAELLAVVLLPRALAVTHAVVVCLLLALTVLPAVKRAASIPGAGSLAIALVVGTLLGVGYLRIRTWRWSVVYLLPVLLVFPIRLLFYSPAVGILLPSRASELARARVGNPVPIVFVVFDEFPVVSLLDKGGQIDANLYPNFAELARSATWYRNATTVSEGTLISIPAILDGTYPDPDHPRLPDVQGYPQTLFTLLGGSYRMNVIENNTRLCPEALCGSSTPPFRRRVPSLIRDAAILWLYTVLPSDLTGPLPDITQSWANFTSPQERLTLQMWDRFDDLADWQDRLRLFRGFVSSIRPSPLPALHFLHVFLPHAPWTYLPSGQEFTLAEARIRGLRGTNDRGEDPNRWTGDPWAVVQSYQRHLLQVQMVDGLVGSLLKRLRDTGLYDSALLIITSDHGASFRHGDSRRILTAANHRDIMAIPLFIKAPHQRRGGIDDRNAESIDILPTIADILQVRPSWKPDGRSLIGSDTPGRRTKIVFSDAGQKFEFAPDLTELFGSLKLKLEIFGQDSRNGALFRAGDRYGWTGREVPSSRARPEPGIQCELDHRAYYSNVDPGRPMVLTNITGRLVRAASAGQPDGPVELAVAVNGTIRAITRSYREGGQEMFSALVPETALHPGGNQIGVFRVRNNGLATLEQRAERKYEWGARLKFGVGGNVEPYYGIGWSGPEPDLVWTDGHVATLYLPAPPPPSNVTMKAMLCAFTYRGKLERQQVRVLVNDREVARWVLAGEPEERTAVVPRDYFAGSSSAEIRFEMPDAAAPVSLGASGDSRTLGMGMTWLEFDAGGRPK